MGLVTVVVLVTVVNVCLGLYPEKFPRYYYPQVYHNKVAACVGQFFCKYSHDQPECLNKHEVCDGMMDCSNGADERNCPPQCAKMGMINCQDRKHCGRLCDGSPDCGGMDDEMHCPAGCFCPENHYLCKDMKTCVSKKQLCDGNNDCPACDDENNCPAECQCGERQYLCMGKEKCINIKQICDGDEDCPMDEDETCRAGCRCNKGQYLCGAAKGAADVCIGLDQFCDSNDDCPNGDDEELKCISVP
ncbi:low-density lipoprotein receptor-related protein 4-like [Mya arenaria]|uniref:low-density lipoprotein receptor-related protein 4-like n=1 Tax=Mya arenaria TaxID=6604 RepID=UPI0022E2FC33|nr:low-density lipoprotein receptor-related protein 4-like [Mya arenaria]